MLSVMIAQQMPSRAVVCPSHCPSTTWAFLGLTNRCWALPTCEDGPCVIQHHFGRASPQRRPAPHEGGPWLTNSQVNIRKPWVRPAGTKPHHSRNQETTRPQSAPHRQSPMRRNRCGHCRWPLRFGRGTPTISVSTFSISVFCARAQFCHKTISVFSLPSRFSKNQTKLPPLKESE